jgi:hypothetical protein
MSQELICAWLGLPTDVWPPDHYSLLGLKPGEDNSELIEESVHQRLDMVRRYQMTNPEPATEAMNRIAQAFVCLTEPVSKRVYDTALLGTVATNEQAAALTQTATDGPEPLVLVYNPTAEETAPPVRVQYDPTSEATAPPVRLQYDSMNQEAMPPVRRTPTPPPQTIPVATAILEAPMAVAVASVAEAAPPTPAQHALTAKRQLYQRIARMRRLLELWEEAGKFLAAPNKRLSRSAEFNELQRMLLEIREGLELFAPLLGTAGQPGHLVLSLVQLTAPPPASQREELSRDWEAGKQVLGAHRDVLRQQARAFHRHTLFQRLGRSVRTTFAEKPGRVLILIALVAVNIAICRTYVVPWLERLVRPALEKVLPSSAIHSIDN